jgi:hypothetical protein
MLGQQSTPGGVSTTALTIPADLLLRADTVIE